MLSVLYLRCPSNHPLSITVLKDAVVCIHDGSKGKSELPAANVSVQCELCVQINAGMDRAADTPPLALEEELHAPKVNIVTLACGHCSALKRNDAHVSINRA